MKKALAYSALGAILSICIFSTGCITPDQGGKTYTTSQAQTQMVIYYGTVLKVEDVKIQAGQSGVGAVAGGVLGGVAGSTVGGGTGKTLATAAGAVGGLVAGQAVEKTMGTKAAVEIEVSLDDGRVMGYVQKKDDTFAVGDRVRVIQTPDGKFRVRK